jgi:hypothetical protein
MSQNSPTDPYKGASEVDLGMGKSYMWQTYASLPATVVGVAANWSELSSFFKGELPTKWSGKGKWGTAIAVGLPAVAGIAGYFSGVKQAQDGQAQYTSMAQKISELDAENTALRASASWAEKTGKKPSELHAEKLHESREHSEAQGHAVG